MRSFMFGCDALSSFWFDVCVTFCLILPTGFILLVTQQSFIVSWSCGCVCCFAFLVSLGKSVIFVMSIIFFTSVSTFTSVFLFCVVLLPLCDSLYSVYVHFADCGVYRVVSSAGSTFRRLSFWFLTILR